MEVYSAPFGKPLAWKSNYEIDNAGNSPSFPEEAIFGEFRRRAPSPAPEEADVYSPVRGAPVREPPAWKLNYQIGSGVFGTVFLEKVQTHGMVSPEFWAVKRILKDVPNFSVRRCVEEIKNLQQLSNRFYLMYQQYEWFVKFISSYEDYHCLYIAMEYIPIGDMSKTFVNNYWWNESDTKVVIEQVLQGLVVMHKEGIIHHDLKPENIFFYLPAGRPRALRVKIGDFGTSTSILMSDLTRYLTTSAGTLGYMAPEVDDTSVLKTNRVDIWSLGCILYRMVTGSPLFNSRRDVLSYADRESSPPWAVRNRNFSVTCEDFLRDVLQVSPGNRPNAESCLKKPWITTETSGSEYSIGLDLCNRLAKIQCAAPDAENRDRFLDMALHQGFDKTVIATSSGTSQNSGSEPSSRTPSPAPGNVEVYPTPIREPPAWRLDCKIGTGAFGTVFLEKVQTRQMRSPELWAVKRISRALPNFPSKQSQAEIKNLQTLSIHEWFVKFHSSYEDADYVYIAMEYITIGDMSKTFESGYQWNESDTKVVIKQLLQGLAVMHQEGITHRDLKPENIFLSLSEDEAQVLHVKIGDFGTSKHIPLFNASTYLKTTTGTLGYMAPEMLDTSKPKTNRVDIWSLGCILYRMFAGSLLFKDPLEVYRYVLTKPTPSLALENRGLSLACVKFLHDLLQPAPEDRPSAEACLENIWIVNDVPGSEYSIGEDLHTKLFKIKQEAPNMDNFSNMVADLGANKPFLKIPSTVVRPAKRQRLAH